MAKERPRNQVSFEVEDTQTLERLNNAIWHIGRGLTVKQILNESLLAAVEALERKHNKGKPFPQREGELPRSPRRARAKKKGE